MTQRHLAVTIFLYFRSLGVAHVLTTFYNKNTHVSEFDQKSRILLIFRSASFELSIEFLLDEEWNENAKRQKLLNESTIGVLWEGVTHQSATIRKVTGRVLTSAARKLSIVEISRQLFPALNSIAQDDQSEVRVEATNTLAVISQRMLADPDDDLDKRLQKLILQVYRGFTGSKIFPSGLKF